ncbi:MAG: hypothetical protein AAFY48_07390 [Bacteroidota bacterium]
MSNYSIYQEIYDDRFLLKSGIEQGLEQVTGGRAQLTPAELDMVLCWIEDGAPE